MHDPFIIALSLTTLAGLSTGIGSAIAFVTRRSNIGFLAAALGFSAGVMIYVSFVELLPTGQLALQQQFGPHLGRWLAAGGLFGGILVVLLIDWLVPAQDNPHEARLVEDAAAVDASSLQRAGLLTALALGIHNFPEGMATFMSAYTDPVVGLTIAIAIALHNIPEGISVAVPIYYATGSRRRAFWLSFLSGLAEPVGALLGFMLLRPFLTPWLLGLVLTAVAGVMLFISLDQLIPNAKKYDQGHQAVYGLVAGMAIMAVTLLLLS